MKNIFLATVLAVATGATIFTVNTPSLSANPGNADDVYRFCRNHCDDADDAMEAVRNGFRYGRDRLDDIRRNYGRDEYKLYENMKKLNENREWIEREYRNIRQRSQESEKDN